MQSNQPPFTGQILRNQQQEHHIKKYTSPVGEYMNNEEAYPGQHILVTNDCSHQTSKLLPTDSSLHNQSKMSLNHQRSV